MHPTAKSCITPARILLNPILGFEEIKNLILENLVPYYIYIIKSLNKYDMDTMQIDEKKSFKKQLFETLYVRFDNSLVEYKEIIGKKKLNRFLKKTSKELAGEINKETRHARKHQKKLEKKAEKIKNEKRE